MWRLSSLAVLVHFWQCWNVSTCFGEAKVELAPLTMCLFACNTLEHVSAVKSPTDWLWTWRQQAHLSDYTQVLSNYILNYRTKNSPLHIWNNVTSKWCIFSCASICSSIATSKHMYMLIHWHMPLQAWGEEEEIKWTILACTWALSSYVNLKSWMALLKTAVWFTSAHLHTWTEKAKLPLYYPVKTDESFCTYKLWWWWATQWYLLTLTTWRD